MVDEDQYWNDGDSIIDLSSEDEKSDAQAEWDESIRELQVILTTLVFPVLGRLVGRQFVLKMFTRFTVNRLLRNAAGS
ncbi:hypothetical protein POJ06DRAFT_128012 [Lipomyces tetrasporus]|uniref:Uncharacterized protein n=1 Tax=Lipomyces tetrasporus TaxID=54092 RepID=A0AAD7QPQ2_9ASCO|nr:uncharacterized protein POJ06DRAFT_128012 [Lipomyces tetrasporus]KAJ8099104.1 hypothetical protein POJ06DRAFT_128012 [Lipomyces tetrasporus]